MSNYDVVFHSEPAEWWQVAATLTPLAASLALVFVLRAVCRLTAAPATQLRTRAEWWSRAERAIDMALDDKPERRKAGLVLVEQLTAYRFVDKEDALLAAEVRASLLDNPQ